MLQFNRIRTHGVKKKKKGNGMKNVGTLLSSEVLIGVIIHSLGYEHRAHGLNSFVISPPPPNIKSKYINHYIFCHTFQL